MKLRFTLSMLGLILMTAGALNAGSILVFEDYTVGQSAISGALALWGGCGTCTTTASYSEFNALLAAGGWDLVIYAEQNHVYYPDVASQLEAWVSGGGRLIGQTWSDSSGLPALMEASIASSNGYIITTDASPIYAGLGTTITLSNPAWGTFSLGWNPTGSALGLGTLDSGGYAAILGNNGATILNAALTDTYLPRSDGERLLANEIEYLLSGTQVPEPSTFVLLGFGLAATLALRKLGRK